VVRGFAGRMEVRSDDAMARRERGWGEERMREVGLSGCRRLRCVWNRMAIFLESDGRTNVCHIRKGAVADSV
jgi:hypothetical protein